MLQVSKSLLPQLTLFTELLHRNLILHLAGFTARRRGMATLRAAKQALRKDVKRRVAALSDTEKRRQSAVVAQQLFRHPKYVSCKRIAVFLSMDDEVRTEEIIKDVFKWGKSCFIPRYDSGSSHMDMLKLNSLQDMETLPVTSWNIPQPADDDNSREEALATANDDQTIPVQEIPVQEKESHICISPQPRFFFQCSPPWQGNADGGLDLILMPGLGFDRLGKRLGRGKGFYDTYLERCIKHSKGKPYTIALAFKEQLCQEIPVDDNDVLIDEVLYEDDE